MQLRLNGLHFGRKEGWELVSEADLRAAEILHQLLQEPFPDTGWLSEEHVDTSARLRCERVWIVDPIDGTREFLQGIPEFAISIGLVERGVPVLGVVHNPATGETFAATVPKLVAAAASEIAAKDDGRKYDVLVGRGEQEWDEIPPLPAGARTRGVGSVAYRLALIAAGKGDAVVTGYGRSEWDVAAGAALCLAAGIPVTGVLGHELRFNQPRPLVPGLLAARAPLHERILQHLRRFAR